MKTIIIDDEKSARRLLNNLLEMHCPQLDVLGEAEGLLPGIRQIKELKPDLVFLDIEMPEQSGLELLNYLDIDNKIPQIIFTTAYNDYAIEAFKLSATDYILKPIDSEELIQAVTKATKQINLEQNHNKLNQLQHALSRLQQNKITIEVPNGLMFLEKDEIIACKADGMYTQILLSDKRQKLISKPLKHMIEELDKYGNFFRNHRSYFINLNHIKEITKKDGDVAILSDEIVVPISKSSKKELLEALQSLSNNN